MSVYRHDWNKAGTACSCGFTGADHEVSAHIKAEVALEIEQTRLRAGTCHKRITYADGRYGFCERPDGHDLHCATSAVSAPPPANTFKPKIG